MATAPKSAATREATPEVQQFIQLSTDLIRAAGDYAAGGVYDKEVDSMVRQIRVMTSSLLAAISNIPAFPPSA